ncbi:uncharacterized protein ColSpa_07295 [Colletotrichum spaethianum]|uniref:Uncharacterized protein n=1 Tax=Colletotrichum spaethianum TaxID=700344 RepID=A0AA37LIY9_9PEZI|nr:uncharacterized protein ColSpa_07295 [Colletotrichum spaethianum]GKT47114.1 hypothetical protein ColSpa_07295 [Colletotrichum spaethianum]
MESCAQIFIADLPRPGDLTDDARDIRPTTPVPSRSRPRSDPSVTALNLRMQWLEKTLTALTEEHEALDRDAADGCRAGLEVADGLLVASAQRGIMGTFWQVCHPSKCSKKRDLLRRHLGIAQHTYETVGKRYQDAVRPLTGLYERVRSLGDNAKQVSNMIHELNTLQECKEKALNLEIRERSEAWSHKTLRLAALRKREWETGAKRESMGIQQTAMDGWHDTRQDDRISWASGLVVCKHAAGMALSLKHNGAVLSSLAQEIWRVASEVEMLKAHVELLQHGRDAMEKAKGLLIAKMMVRMEVFQAEHSRLSAELQDEEKPLKAVGDDCLRIAARLDALKESNFGDLVFGVRDLARSVAVKNEKKEKRKCSKGCKPAGRPYTSITSRLMMR